MSNILVRMLIPPFFLALGGVLTGCWTDKSGTHHVLVVGIGVVSVNNSKPSAATIIRTHTLGIAVLDQTGVDVGIGYSSGLVTAVPDGAEDVRIEASKRMLAPIIIEVQSAKLNRTNQTQITKEKKNE